MTDTMHDTEDANGTFEDFDVLSPDNDFLTIIRVSIANDGLNPLVTCQPLHLRCMHGLGEMLIEPQGSTEHHGLAYFSVRHSTFPPDQWITFKVSFHQGHGTTLDDVHGGDWAKDGQQMLAIMRTVWAVVHEVGKNHRENSDFSYGDIAVVA